MLANLRISELAERAGITPATVRYYERVGILPAADRSPNGYRIYDERTVDRLGFIVRAKQLGCTLTEVGDLVVAWDGGRCGPVQDRLRSLVADKLGAAQAEIDALRTLSDELRQAAIALETHRPDGPCDDRCGCLNQPSTALPVALTRKSEDPGAIPIACSLSPDEAQERVEQWQRIVGDQPGAGGVTARLAIPNGVRLEFDGAADVTALVDLARAEQDCCRFFSFAVTIDHRGVGLEITGPAEARSVIEGLFGTTVATSPETVQGIGAGAS